MGRKKCALDRQINRPVPKLICVALEISVMATDGKPPFRERRWKCARICPVWKEVTQNLLENQPL